MSNKLAGKQKVSKGKKKKGFDKKYIKPIIIGSICAILFVAASAALVLSEDEDTAVTEPDITQCENPKEGDTVAELHIKDYGVIKVRFFEEITPKAVENFIELSKEGYYDGVSFHRVIEDFMIQGGDPTGTGYGGESIWGTPFEDEFSLQLFPVRGALCMANSGDDTNGSQFFIVTQNEYDMEYAMNYENIIENDVFEYYIENGGAAHLYGKHTVFGQVYEGMDVADAISRVSVDSSDKPTEDVIIEKIVITTYES